MDLFMYFRYSKPTFAINSMLDRYNMSIYLDLKYKGLRGSKIMEQFAKISKEI
jgi:hypothetical protein